MTGRLHRSSAHLGCTLLLAIALGHASCADRGLDDGMEAEPAEHPPELIEGYEQACEDWCALVDDCARGENLCDCTDRDFSEKHVLCVEKAMLRLECEAALTCEGIDLLFAEEAQDRRCYGEGIAEFIACYE